MTNRETANAVTMRVIETVYPRNKRLAAESYAHILATIEQALSRANLDGRIQQLEWALACWPLNETSISAECARLKAELAKERR